MRQARYRLQLACITCMAALVAMAFLAAFPPSALAASGSYAIDELSTQLTVETNGAVHVVERQTLTFDEGNEGLVWYLHVPEEGESVRIASVRYAPVDTGGTLLDDWVRLQMIDSNPREQGRNPGDTADFKLRAQGVEQPWYSYNIGDGMVRCYFPTGAGARAEAESGEAYHTYVVETDYTVYHRMRVYRDVAELYWRYANDSLPVEASNVSLRVQLPLPADIDPAQESAEIAAWGHGPDAGTFNVGEDGTVTYLIEHLARGNYAEAHLVFPASWLDDVYMGLPNTFSELRRDAAVAEESEWVDLAQREEAWDNKVRMLFLALAVLVMLAGVVGVIRHGRTPAARRALMRAAATMGIVTLGEQLFFHEPLTTLMLAALTLAMAAVALMLPLIAADGDPDDEPDADANDEASRETHRATSR